MFYYTPRSKANFRFDYEYNIASYFQRGLSSALTVADKNINSHIKFVAKLLLNPV